MRRQGDRAQHKRRAAFIVEVVERELRRREQLDALREAAGSWQDEAHPELAEGGDKWVREMRRNSARRLERIDQQTQAK